MSKCGFSRIWDVKMWQVIIQSIWDKLIGYSFSKAFSINQYKTINQYIIKFLISIKCDYIASEFMVLSIVCF